MLVMLRSLSYGQALQTSSATINATQAIPRIRFSASSSDTSRQRLVDRGVARRTASGS